MDLVFKVYVPQFEAAKLLDLLAYLHTLSTGSAELEEAGAVEKLESNLKRYYIVHALQKGRPDRVLEFFEHYGEGLLHTADDWTSWFGNFGPAWIRYAGISFFLFPFSFFCLKFKLKFPCLQSILTLVWSCMVNAALPYMKLPITAPSMEAYFSSQWLDSLKVSFRTYVSEAFKGIHILFITKCFALKMFSPGF